MKTLTLTIKAVFDDEWKLVTKESDIDVDSNSKAFSLNSLSKALAFGTVISLWSGIKQSIEQWMKVSTAAKFFSEYITNLLKSFILVFKWINPNDKDIKNLIDEINNI